MHIPDFRIERFFAQWEFAMQFVMCASDVEGWRMADLLALADDEMRELWSNMTLGYTETSGHPLLRAEIAKLYDGVRPDEVLVFAGAGEPIFALMNVALSAGDHAITFKPSYQSLYEVSRATGAEVTFLPLTHENGWQVDLAALRDAIRPTTRLITVNFPHNPTGALPDPATFRAIVELADEAGITLLSDEVYRLMEYAPADRLPAAASISRRAVSVGVMSKSFGLAGLRIGWLVTHDAALRARIASFKDYLTMCSSAPSEILALIALRAKGQVVGRSLDIITRNLALADTFFAEHAHRFEWVRPRAGSIGFPRLLGPIPIDKFALDLARTQSVLLLPGTVYDMPGNHFRFGLGRTNFAEGLARLGRFVE